jgi:hypothetical protein
MQPGNEDEDTPETQDSTHIDDPGRFDDADTTGPISPHTAGSAEGEREEEEAEEDRETIEDEAVPS